jgi:amidase
MDDELCLLPAYRLMERILAKTLRPTDLLEAYLARIHRFDDALNAVVVRQEDVARRRAEAADQALARGEIWGPLHGLPITVKESFDVAGLPSTFGLTTLRDNVAQADSAAVARLAAAGANVLGKTNVPVQLADWQSANPIYGATRNPWDMGRSPGGSSGGSAVALAAGLSALELGSDIGGSIRMPAHFCGVWGHKPSLGLVPGRGHAQPGNVAPADMTVHGPLARSARDLALALSLLAGAEDDAGGVTLHPPSGRRPQDYRVALLANDPDFPVDSAVADGLRAAAESLSRIGVTVIETRPADIPSRACYETYIYLLRGATSGRQTDQEFAEAAQGAAGLDPADRSYRALMLRANSMTHRDWLGFNQQRYGFIAAWRRFFADFDALLCPVASTPAFPVVFDTPKHARTVTVDGRELPSANDYFWLGLASLSYLPATTVPVALSPEGLPIGAQILGAFGADRTCLELATLLEDCHRAFRPPPMDRLG